MLFRLHGELQNTSCQKVGLGSANAANAMLPAAVQKTWESIIVTRCTSKGTRHFDQPTRMVFVVETGHLLHLLYSGANSWKYQASKPK